MLMDVHAKNCKNFLRHGCVNVFSIVLSGVLLTCLFYPFINTELPRWLVSLQIMGGISVFTYYGFTEGYIEEVIPHVVIGFGLPFAFIALHIVKKSIICLYLASLLWVLSGWVSVIAARI